LIEMSAIAGETLQFFAGHPRVNTNENEFAIYYTYKGVQAAI